MERAYLKRLQWQESCMKHMMVWSIIRKLCVCRMEFLKKLLFTQRLVAYNETFVPLGAKKIKGRKSIGIT